MTAQHLTEDQIQRMIAADPDAPEASADQLAQARPFRELFPALRIVERPALQFAAVVLPAPEGWESWGRMRVTALNYGPVSADLRQICRQVRLGGRIVSMLEVAHYNEATQSESWPPRPRGGNCRCSDVSEYRVPVGDAAQPGTVSFDVLIRPGRGLAKLGYKVKYRWTDQPDEILTGMVRP
ncbi:hypothetical protein RAH32_20940 [Paracoccus sp. WLY502]|uniref:hypothetical protein n=1 Tax=Paracoccus yibinensis TaxID=3068891 RepID=UPI00279644B1|nr:hypothetical protein [Paracoccus sp. WLY502]MDQ1902882.1 hypothetical protein [Paracoccus sp. WLY502]